MASPAFAAAGGAPGAQAPGKLAIVAAGDAERDLGRGGPVASPRDAVFLIGAGPANATPTMRGAGFLVGDNLALTSASLLRAAIGKSGWTLSLSGSLLPPTPARVVA
ncbi:MAG: hypothetical protein LBF40_01280, partial [Deltaproteobacteria bacterium]|nr:hypothetical protein [Deltaproteobacteria bacterium]